MPFQFSAPVAFFQSEFVPHCCIITGRTENLRQAELRLFQPRTDKPEVHLLNFQLPTPPTQPIFAVARSNNAEFFSKLLVFATCVVGMAALGFGWHLPLIGAVVAIIAAVLLTIFERVREQNTQRLLLHVCTAKTIPTFHRWRNRVLIAMKVSEETFFAGGICSLFYAPIAYRWLASAGFAAILPGKSASPFSFMPVIFFFGLLSAACQFLQFLLNRALYPQLAYHRDENRIELTFPNRSENVFTTYTEALERWKQSLPLDQRPTTAPAEESWTENIPANWDEGKKSKRR